MSVKDQTHLVQLAFDIRHRFEDDPFEGLAYGEAAKVTPEPSEADRLNAAQKLLQPIDEDADDLSDEEWLECFQEVWRMRVGSNWRRLNGLTSDEAIRQLGHTRTFARLAWSMSAPEPPADPARDEETYSARWLKGIDQSPANEEREFMLDVDFEAGILDDDDEDITLDDIEDVEDEEPEAIETIFMGIEDQLIEGEDDPPS